MQLRNIRLAGNEHGQLKADVIYAELYDDQGNMVISATLEYILVTIRQRKYQVDGVAVELKDERRTVCSYVSLTRY